MSQLSLTILLALSISANFVFTVEVFQADTANLQNESSVGAVQNNNQTKESLKTHEEPTSNVTKNNSTLEGDQRKVDTSKEQAKNSTTPSLTPRNVTLTSSVQNVTQNVKRPTEETTPMTEVEVVTQNAGNFTGEQANLNQCCVHPPDADEKDNVTIETPKEKATTAGSTLGPTTLPSTVVTINSTNNTNATIIDDSSPPKFFPITKDVKNISDVSSDLAARLNSTFYKTIPPDADNVTEAITSKILNATVATTITTIATPTVVTIGPTNASIVLKNNQTKNENGRLAMEEVGNLQKAELNEKGKESGDGNKNESMPSGIIALVTAISFAVAIAIGYISMVVWKQYLEHRYGRRELLVNELEFDTNDLRHFEL